MSTPITKKSTDLTVPQCVQNLTEQVNLLAELVPIATGTAPAVILRYLCDCMRLQIATLQVAIDTERNLSGDAS